MKQKPLSAFRYLNTRTVCRLPGLKNIMRVKTARTWQWWLILPASGENDARCIHLKTTKLSDRGHLALIDERQIIETEQARNS